MQYAINAEDLDSRLEVSAALKRYVVPPLILPLTFTTKMAGRVASLGYLSKRFASSHAAWYICENMRVPRCYAAGSVRGCHETQWVHALSRPGFIAYVA